MKVATSDFDDTSKLNDEGVAPTAETVSPTLHESAEGDIRTNTVTGYGIGSRANENFDGAKLLLLSRIDDGKLIMFIDLQHFVHTSVLVSNTSKSGIGFPKKLSV